LVVADQYMKSRLPDGDSGKSFVFQFALRNV
jgi:hypothetical protein